MYNRLFLLQFGHFTSCLPKAEYIKSAEKNVKPKPGKIPIMVKHNTTEINKPKDPIKNI